MLGSTLWLVLYDGFLRLDQPQVVRATGFADDLAIVVKASDGQIMEHKTNKALLEDRALNEVEKSSWHLRRRRQFWSQDADEGRKKRGRSNI